MSVLRLPAAPKAPQLTEAGKQWFCDRCGTIRQRARDQEALRCVKCGVLGLVPFDPKHPPSKLPCNVPGCSWACWDNGRSGNDFLAGHISRRHKGVVKCGK